MICDKCLLFIIDSIRNLSIHPEILEYFANSENCEEIWKQICDHMTQFPDIIGEATQFCVLIQCHENMCNVLEDAVGQSSNDIIHKYEEAIKSHKECIKKWCDTILQMPSKQPDIPPSVWDDNHMNWGNEQQILKAITADSKSHCFWNNNFPVSLLTLFLFFFFQQTGFFLFLILNSLKIFLWMILEIFLDHCNVGINI